MKGIYIAARGLDNRMKNLEIVANNLANINTVGYKKDLSFFEMMNQFGESNVRKSVDFTQGNMIQTNNPLDVALSGKGFFVVNGPNGPELTRNGKFGLSEDGFLINENGHQVQGKNGLINFREIVTSDNSQITINKHGDIMVGDIPVDSFLIVLPDNPMNIEKHSALNFNVTDGSFIFPEENSFEIAQGYLEESNVNPVLEMESMIKVSVNYESNNKIINILDQSLEKANEIGRV